MRKKSTYHANTNDTLTVHNLCKDEMEKHLDIMRKGMCDYVQREIMNLQPDDYQEHNFDNPHRVPTPVQAHRCLIQTGQRRSVI